MAEDPIQGLMNVTMDKIRQMADSNTIIGTPIKTDDGTTILPVSRISFGFAETDGLGARWKEPARAEAFIGLSAFGGDTIEAITGATVTSKAVLAASNDVLKCISHVLGKDVEGDVLAFGVKEEKPA